MPKRIDCEEQGSISVIMYVWAVVCMLLFSEGLCVANIAGENSEGYLTLLDSLKNQHIVIMGDSLSRYHYISLVYHLRHSQPVSNLMAPSPVREKTWKSWNEFYTGTSAGLYPELCDCYRNERSRTEEIFENRYYHDIKNNIRVTYYQFFGDTVHGHWSPPGSPADLNTSAFSKTNISYPSKELIPAFWEYAPHELYGNHSAFLTPKPTIMVMNAGLWRNKFHSRDYVTRLVNSYSNLNMFIWRTTTSRFKNETNRGHVTDPLVCGREDLNVLCFNVSWTKYCKKEDYWDDKHFIAPIYTTLNMQLAALIAEYRVKGKNTRPGSKT